MNIKLKDNLKLYLKYVDVLLKSTMEYKVSFFISVLGQLIITFNFLIGIYFLFARFHSVKGFTFDEVIFCASIILMSFSIAESYARGFDTFSSIVINAEFDRMLVRPLSLILQVLGSKFEFARIGRLLQAVLLLIYGIIYANVSWNILKVITLIFMLIGGISVFTGLFWIYASLCFFTLDGLEFINIFTDGARTFAAYPVSIYGKRILKICTFIIPYSLFQYYPLLYLFDKTTNHYFILLPLLAVLFLVPCYGLWRLGVSRYQSSGS